MSQRPNTFALTGGMDVSTSPLYMNPGRLMSGINYEVVAEGYRRMDGIERFDGQPAPSAARFWSLPYTNGIMAPEVGQEVRGAASGATGIVLAVPAPAAGTWADRNAAGEIVLAEVDGTFADGENLYSGSVLRALAAGEAQQDFAPSTAALLDRTALAQAMQREHIGRVPGSGPVRGVAIHDGAVYAWRDNVEGTAGAMYRATASGWEKVDTGRWLRFSAGLVEIADGTRIYGATSGASATAARVVRKSGDWGSTAAGYIVLSDQDGNFQAETLVVGGQNVATAAPDVAISLPAGGRYETISHNFYGSADTFALYGVSGQGNAFEFCKGIYTPIETGMGAADKPYLIFEIAQALGLVYPGGSIQIGAVGEPLTFDGVQGASEIGFGSEITNVVQSAETAVVFFGRQRIATLSGQDSDSYTLSELTEEAGALPWTAQRLARTLYIDARGLRDLSATQAYGNFRAGSLLPEMARYFSAKASAGVEPVLSFVAKGKSQYRVLYSDGTGLSVFMGRKYPECLLFSVKPLSFTCGATGELADGEAILAGGDDGFVYRIDSGTSLDGSGITGFVMPASNHIGSAMVEKRLHKTTVELDGGIQASIGITVFFDYGQDYQPIAGSRDFTVRGSGGNDLLVQAGGGRWDTALWDQFFWSAPIRGWAEAYTEGMGVNMTPIIACAAHPAEPAHTLQAYTFHWSPRKMRR